MIYIKKTIRVTVLVFILFVVIVIFIYKLLLADDKNNNDDNIEIGFESIWVGSYSGDDFFYTTIDDIDLYNNFIKSNNIDSNISGIDFEDCSYVISTLHRIKRISYNTSNYTFRRQMKHYIIDVVFYKEEEKAVYLYKIPKGFISWNQTDMNHITKFE